MKDKVIEAAGKTWRYLGQNGETSMVQLPKALQEKPEVIMQAVGWLAREDKINYATKNRRTFVSLVENEIRAFNTQMYKMNQTIVDSASNVSRKAKAKK